MHVAMTGFSFSPLVRLHKLGSNEAMRSISDLRPGEFGANGKRKIGVLSNFLNLFVGW